MANLRFTAGDNLQGILKAYHLVMMKNELKGGYGAYELSYAGKAVSGPSFGGTQMDLAVNSKAREIFKTIILTSFNILNPDEQNEIFAKLNDPQQLHKTPIEIFGTILVGKINQALSSDNGIKLINQAYLDDIKTKAVYIETIIKDIKHPVAKAFYDSLKGRVLLFDYHNQYNLEKNGKFATYLSQGSTNTFTGKKLSFANEFTYSHHQEFIFNTKYGHNNPGDAARRFNNIDDAVTEIASAAAVSSEPIQFTACGDEKLKFAGLANDIADDFT